MNLSAIVIVQSKADRLICRKNPVILRLCNMSTFRFTLKNLAWHFSEVHRYKTIPSYPMLIFLSEVQEIGHLLPKNPPVLKKKVRL